MQPTGSEITDDELDKLMQQYDEEAKQDVEAAIKADQKPAKKPKLSQSQAARVSLKAALDKPLSEDNLGYQMLTKTMGYKPGTSLGKQQGLIEPIPVVVKQNKLGLGAVNKTEAKRQAAQNAQEQAEIQTQQLQQQTERHVVEKANTHRLVQAERFSHRRVEGQLRAAQRAIETLDARHGITFNYMWMNTVDMDSHTAEPHIHDSKIDNVDPKATPPTEGVDQIEKEQWETLSVGEKLQVVLNHLRERYNYCLFCGVEYKDKDDMLQNCPGQDEDVH